MFSWVMARSQVCERREQRDDMTCDATGCNVQQGKERRMASMGDRRRPNSRNDSRGASAKNQAEDSEAHWNTRQ